jgi:hypothetical protein
LNSTTGFFLHQEILEKEDPQVTHILGRNGWALTSHSSLNLLQQQIRNVPVANSFGPHQSIKSIIATYKTISLLRHGCKISIYLTRGSVPQLVLRSNESRERMESDAI